MMPQTINIKLTIWGTNGGSQTFCTDLSKGELSSPEIRGAMQEFTSVFRKAGIPFWGLEFTSRYKVYTAYYSALESRSSRSGIFFAATIFVPHEFKIIDVYAYLKEVGIRARNEFLDSDGRYKQAMLPLNIERDFAGFRECEVVPEFIKRTNFTSNVSGSIAYIIYSNEAELVTLLENPYRKELKQYQELLLIPEEHVLSGYFNKDVGVPLTMSALSPQQEGYHLLASDFIKQILVNGEDRTKSYTTNIVSEGDTLSITFKKKGCIDFCMENVSVKTLLNRGILFPQGNFLSLDPSKITGWKRQVKIALSPQVFNQTRGVTLKVNDGKIVQGYPLNSHLKSFCFELEIEEKYLPIGALLSIQLEPKDSRVPRPTPIKLTNGTDVSLLRFSYGEQTIKPPYHKQPSPIDDPIVKDQDKSHHPIGKFFATYWRGTLIAFLSFLLVGYLLGCLYPLPFLRSEKANDQSLKNASEKKYKKINKEEFIKAWKEAWSLKNASEEKYKKINKEEFIKAWKEAWSNLKAKDEIKKERKGAKDGAKADARKEL